MVEIEPDLAIFAVFRDFSLPMGLELGLEFVLFNRENPLFDKKTTYIIGNSIVKTIGDM